MAAGQKAISEAGARRAHLVEQQLHENEVVDGLFEVHGDRLVAVTSERIMIVSGGDAKGWSLTGIPWRVVLSVEAAAGEAEEPNTLEVKYTARSTRAGRKGETTESEASIDIGPEAVEDGADMVRLMNARLETNRAES